MIGKHKQPDQGCGAKPIPLPQAGGALRGEIMNARRNHTVAEPTARTGRFELGIKYCLADWLLNSDLLHLADTDPVMKSTARRNTWINKHRPAMAVLVAECIINRLHNRHAQSRGNFFLGNVQTDLRTIFGRPRKPETGKKEEGFYLYNQKLNIFYQAKPEVKHKFAAAWQLTPSFIQKLDNQIQINYDYKALRSFFQPHQPPAEYDAYTCLQLNADAIQSAQHSLTWQEFSEREKLTLYAVAAFTHLNHGQYPQYYRENSTTRLYAVTSNTLQAMKGTVRNLALEQSGYHAYDMDVAAFSILMHYVSGQSNYPTITSYIANKVDQRKQIAIDTNSDINKQVKPAITAILFGSNLTSDYSTSEIPEAVRKRIAKHPIVKGIKSELSQLKLDVCKRKNLTKELWVERKRVEKEAREQAAEDGKQKTHWRRDWMIYLYQSRERLALDAMRSCLNDKTDCLLLHDGIYTKENKNPAELEEAILLQTGLTIKITKD